MADCLATYSTNNADCDPLKHGIACHWCCPDAACVQTLSTGVYNPPALPTTSLPVGTTAPAVQTNPPAMTSAAPMMTSAPMMTTQAAAMTTIPPDPVQSTAAGEFEILAGI
ncbi:hypothetical protein BaRGS_00018987 [Batillaria attramentaria]|uniref:Uncharacterized protein n=1 Tax=Batillaria attramentaria TaxID=370345 RepID=A0ABD0KSN5_9CAEN